MGKIIITNVLDIFVKPVSEGGYGIPYAIVGYMTEPRSYTTKELYTAYQADGSLSADAKALDYTEFKKVTSWMVGKTFDEKTVTDQLGLQIEYTPESSFGAETMTEVTGTDNGDGTRTVTLSGWKPDGRQFRWGIAYPISADTTQFSSLNSISATFTGNKGVTYTLFAICEVSTNNWKIAYFTIGFAA